MSNQQVQNIRGGETMERNVDGMQNLSALTGRSLISWSQLLPALLLANSGWTQSDQNAGGWRRASQRLQGWLPMVRARQRKCLVEQVTPLLPFHQRGLVGHAQLVKPVSQTGQTRAKVAKILLTSTVSSPT